VKIPAMLDARPKRMTLASTVWMAVVLPVVASAAAVAVTNPGFEDLYVPGVSGLEVDFDDVRLEAISVAAVPVAGWASGAVCIGLAALGVFRMRRMPGAH
jgi:hypothetical protein